MMFQFIVQTHCLCVYDLTVGGSEHYDLFLYFYDTCEWPLVLFATSNV